MAHSTSLPTLSSQPVQPHTRSRKPISSTKADIKEFQTCMAVKGALKKQILVAAADVHLSSIKNPVLGHANLTCVQLTPLELADNMMIHLIKPWDPSTPIKMVVNQIDCCVNFAEDGKALILAAIILNTACILVFNSGAHFDKKNCEWERKPEVDWASWDQLKTFMLAAQMCHDQMQKVGGAHHYANTTPL